MGVPFPDTLLHREFRNFLSGTTTAPLAAVNPAPALQKTPEAAGWTPVLAPV